MSVSCGAGGSVCAPARGGAGDGGGGFLSLGGLGAWGATIGGGWAAPLGAGDGSRVASGISTDTRQPSPGAIFIALKGERFDGHDALAAAAKAGCIAAVVARADPEAQIPQLVVPDTLAALQSLAVVWRARLAATVVAVTGSAGKTTTHRLLAAALRAAAPTHASPKSFNNHIGVPVTICQCPADAAFLVCEVGTNHPGEIAALGAIVRPHLAIITNAGRVHLEGLGGLEGVIAEKSSLASCLMPGGTVVAPIDQPALYEAVASRGCRVIPFGSEAAGAGGVGIVARRPDGSRQDVDVLAFGQRATVRLALPGLHNARNACAALAAAIVLGVPREVALEGIASVAPAEMRMVREDIGAWRVYNDAYNANPEAMRASLEAFAEMEPSARRVLVMGEMRELGEAGPALHAEVGAASALHVPVGIFIGRLTRHAGAAAAARGVASHSFEAIDDRTIHHVRALLRDGDAVLVKGSRGSAMERLIEGLRAARA